MPKNDLFGVRIAKVWLRGMGVVFYAHFKDTQLSLFDKEHSVKYTPKPLNNKAFLVITLSSKIFAQQYVH